MFTRLEDVIYGRKFGTALTMDVFRPQHDANKAGLIFAISGGWAASHEAIEAYLPMFLEPMVNRGYTVFAVVPSSQSKYAIPEIVEDMHRAVRYIRYLAAEYSVDPNRLGIYGCSAGGHLSLMIGLTGGPGEPDSDDPVAQSTSRVQAVGAFCAPTDFFNYGADGAIAIGSGVLSGYKAPFDFTEQCPETGSFSAIADPQRFEEIGRYISPITHVSPEAPPTMLIHGDADVLVPLQQSRLLVEALEAAGVENQLTVVPGGEHSLAAISGEVETLADWFDAHIL